jgi:hypothetical protein
MTAGATAAQRLLAAEAGAWRDMPAPEYDATVTAMFDNLGLDAGQAELAAALATASLGRPGEDLVESRAAASERMLELSRLVTDPDQRSRYVLLFLAGWLRVAATAARTPEFIEASPPLPEGVVLPTGADPSQIADPALRAQAETLAREHEAQSQRWNTGQAAITHLQRLAALAREPGPEPDALMLAMSLAPGLPPELRRELEAGSGRSG